MQLKDKVVLVTGGSSGIGKATAVAFAKEGCSVIVNFKSDIKSAEGIVEECNRYSGGNMLLKADVGNEESVSSMFQEIREKFGSLDVLVNNAGIFDENDSPTNLDAFESIYKNNFLSCVTVTKYALELMKTGKIVNLSSIHGRVGHGNPHAIAYSAFKAALESYTKNLAKDLAPEILVNAIAPGRVITPQWGTPDSKEQEELGQAHLIKRMILPEEIAEGIVFLAKSDAACGEILSLDGGMSLVTLG